MGRSWIPPVTEMDVRRQRGPSPPRNPQASRALVPVLRNIVADVDASRPRKVTAPSVSVRECHPARLRQSPDASAEAPTSGQERYGVRRGEASARKQRAPGDISTTASVPGGQVCPGPARAMTMWVCALEQSAALTPYPASAVPVRTAQDPMGNAESKLGPLQPAGANAPARAKAIQAARRTRSVLGDPPVLIAPIAQHYVGSIAPEQAAK
jgi:hypothetical protein